VKAGLGEIETCAGCGGLLRVCAVIVPAPADEYKDLLTRAFTVEGLVTAVAIGIPGWLRNVGGLLGLMIDLIYIAGLAGYYFLIVDHIGRGRPGLPGASDSVSTWGSTAQMALRGMACALVGLLPYLATEIAPLWYPNLSFGPFAVAAVLAFGQLYTPAVILAVVMSNSTLMAFYPVAWVQIISRAPIDYLKLVGVYLLALFVWMGASLLADATLARIWFVGGLLSATVSNLFLFVQAALVGGFLRRHAGEYGY
jgi:hypothetical protein